MGYVPPIKDDQLLIYGNRQSLHSQLIKGTPATEKVVFFNTLQGDSNFVRFPKNIYDPKLLRVDLEKPVKSIERIKEIEQKVTGKGTTIDVTI